MQSFREFLESRQQGSTRGNFKPKRDEKLSKEDEYEITRGSQFLKPYSFMGFDVKMTVHAQARTIQRRPDLDHNDMIELHNKVINDLNKKFRPYGFYLYYSESQEQGYVVQFSQGKKLKVITVLPRKKHKTDSSTKLIIVESSNFKDCFDLWEDLDFEIIQVLQEQPLIII